MKKLDVVSKKHKKARLAIMLSLALAAYTTPAVMAMPQGGVIVGGNGNISASGNSMTVAQQTQNLFVNWDKFSVGKGEKVQFAGPQNFAVLNRVVGHDESKIYGQINVANNGNVYLINPNGILISDGAVINAGSFVASTKDVVDVPNFIASGKVNFKGDAQGNIINLGAIKADRIEMHGDTISLKAANVNKNFDAPQILIDANFVHAGVRDGETTAEVDSKLGVTSEVFKLKDTMQEIRQAAAASYDGRCDKYMLNNNDLTSETWDDSYKPNLLTGAAIDGLGYTVGNKIITPGGDGTGIFGYFGGDVTVDNFIFDNIKVNSEKYCSGTGILVGWLDGSNPRISNVTISNSRVTGYNYVGGLIGYAHAYDTVTLHNVHNINTSVTGVVEKIGSNYSGEGIGGIIGYQNGWYNAEKKNIFRNVSNSGKITGRMNVGGLVGHLVSADMDQVRNTGRIEQQTKGELVNTFWGEEMQYAASDFIGGIAGSIGPKDEAVKGVHISNAYNGGTIGVDTSVDGYYKDGNYIGCIVGMISGYDNGNIYGAKDTVIEYAHNTGTITTGKNNIGGIVGFATVAKDGSVDDVILRHSWNDGKITGFEAVGGLAGEFGGRLVESYNNAPITGLEWSEDIGGLIGRKDKVLNSDLYVSDSYNTAKGKIEGTYHMGGILGYNDSSGKLTMKRVYNMGLIYKGIQNVGGIIGRLDSNLGSAELDQLVNFGNIYYHDMNDGTVNGYEYGGLIGEADMNTGTSLSLTNSTNYGNINGKYSLGGLIGELYNEKGVTVRLENNKNYGNIYTNINHSTTRQVGGLIGQYDSNDGVVEIIGNANYGNIKVEGPGATGVGGIIGDMWDGKLILKDTHNYGTITGAYISGGILGNIYNSASGTDWPDLATLCDMLELHNVTTVGNAFDEGLQKGEWTAATDFVNELKVSGNLQEGITQIPDISNRPDADFLNWGNNVTMDHKGQLGTETGSYPDGGYVWKMYETDQKDSNGNTLHHKPLLTAFMTKVETVEGSVGSNSGNVAGALYDVTMPDGQQIKGITWEHVLALQDQFTRVNNRGDGTSAPAYTASNTENNGSVPGNIFGYYNSSQQGLNIFIKPETVKPDLQPDIPQRPVSRNDYLYSDTHDTGDGKLQWYMHMPPVIYVEDTGVKIEDELTDK